MISIHKTALVDPGATLGMEVEIGPFCVVGPHTEIGDHTILHSHAVLVGRTSLGEGCQIFSFASIGHAPQAVKYRGEPSRIEIGSHTIIREHVTISPGTEGGGMVTGVGSHCLLMGGAHVAHDCQLGDHVILASNATLGGHVMIEDHATLDALSAVHQFVRIGAYALIDADSGIGADVIPFGRATGNRAALSGLNLTGLKRHGFPGEQAHELRQAYRLLFSDESTLKERISDVENAFPANLLVKRVIEFLKTGAERSFLTPNYGATRSAEPLLKRQH